MMFVPILGAKECGTIALGALAVLLFIFEIYRDRLNAEQKFGLILLHLPLLVVFCSMVIFRVV